MKKIIILSVDMGGCTHKSRFYELITAIKKYIDNYNLKLSCLMFHFINFFEYGENFHQKLKIIFLTSNEKYIKTDKDQIAQKTRIMGLATSVANECSGQSFTERIKWISEKRQEGNKLYKENKYEDALNLYITTLCALDFKTCSGEVSEE